MNLFLRNKNRTYFFVSNKSMNEQQKQTAIQMYKNKMMARYRLCIMSSKNLEISLMTNLAKISNFYS
ncbi:hypothetical protein GCM10008107_11130 [Psychrosphaera saromensis]|nr:hypothetical protein GCM10008107_11130 [Psychrosphaera saromensis]GLQ15616.1 hypothetical protein GCM10007917_30710 [Psychrosphaera saromensis]